MLEQSEVVLVVWPELHMVEEPEVHVLHMQEAHSEPVGQLDKVTASMGGRLQGILLWIVCYQWQMIVIPLRVLVLWGIGKVQVTPIC